MSPFSEQRLRSLLRAARPLGLALVLAFSGSALVRAADDLGEQTPPTSQAEAGPLKDGDSAEDQELHKIEAERKELQVKIAAYQVTDKEGQKSLRGRIKAALEEKLGHLDSLAAALRDQKKYRDPKAAEAEEKKLAAKVKAAKAEVDDAVKNPETLLAKKFRVEPAEVTDDLLEELKKKLDEALAERERRRSQGAKFRAESRGGATETNRIRDQIAQVKGQIAELTALPPERDLVAREGTGEDTRRLAELTRENLALAIRVCTERRTALELEREAMVSRGPLSDLRADLEERKAGVAYFQAQVFQKQYDALLKARIEWLLAEAERKRQQARSATDPLAAYRARRGAENLVLDAEIHRAEVQLSGPITKLAQDQKNSLHEVEDDFQELLRIVQTSRAREVVNDRLQRDYRQLQTARSALLSDDLKSIGRQLNETDNRLADVELKLTSFRSTALAEIETVQASVPPARADEARRVAIEHILHRKDLLRRQAQTLREIDAKLDEARDSVTARLAVLEQRAAFVRARIFWIQSEPPLRLDLAHQAAADVRGLVRWAAGLARPRVLWPGWRSASSPFWLTLAGAALLPLGLIRPRRSLEASIGRPVRVALGAALPGDPPTEDAAAPVLDDARTEGILRANVVDALLQNPESSLPVQEREP